MFLDPELTYSVIKTYHHDQTAFTQVKSTTRDRSSTTRKTRVLFFAI